MRRLRNGLVIAPVLAVVWAFLVAIVVSVGLSFTTGAAFRPGGIGCVVLGVALALLTLRGWPRVLVAIVGVILGGALMLTPLAPIVTGAGVGAVAFGAGAAMLGLGSALPLVPMLRGLPAGPATRHEAEAAISGFLFRAGLVVFAALVIIPFYVMVMTSLKSQGALLQNPLDFSIDLTRGAELFRSYIELFRDFRFGSYLWTSFYVSVLTVLITLMFSVPGAYAVARLRFRGESCSPARSC
ncbi:Inner membrane ABC transporter permease protein YcjP [Rhodovulum sp. P5]|nr:Inner membrane ABC transporter permease protein YcjP [Rhodovulum sp. P5]